MINIELKEFQTNTVNQLLDVTTVGLKKEILLQSPTGSGKTIILLKYIEEYIKENKNTIFIWLTPGKGNLEEQSQNKMNKYIHNLTNKNLQDVLLQGLDAKDTAFLNWESITKKGNTALKETERKNLLERIREAHNKDLNFIVIVDEEHNNKTAKAEAIIDAFDPVYIVRVSATTKTNKEAEYIEIDELDVINSGLITKALYINESVSNITTLDNEHEYLINLANNKRLQIREEYKQKKISVNPLVIIQVPNNSDDFIEQIENILNNLGFSYENKAIAKWLSGSKINTENIEDNFNEVKFIIMKQAISTGWDCPRAKILVKLRNNMKEDFEIQILGRIRRMPQAHHYENNLMDNCYLYTFDEKYEEAVKQELGMHAHDSKVIFLKDEYKDFSLVKSKCDTSFDGFDDKQTFNILFEYFKNTYNLTTKKIDNKIVLEAAGYDFSETINRNIIQGKVIKLNAESLNNIDKIKINSTVSTNKNGFEMRQTINTISSKIGIKYDKTRLMLERLFHKGKLFTKKFVNLSLLEFYAFVINNEDRLKHDFYEAVTSKARTQKLDLEYVEDSNWKLPQTNYVKYDSKMKDSTIYEKNVYKQYPSSSLKSRSESMFEEFCNSSNDIKWVFKNGEKSDEYFCIPYKNAINKYNNFYPDYILEDTKGEIWIIETKGGENSSGNSKNIDKTSYNKFEALKEYSKKYNLNFGFVRDYDKNNKLYICNTEYTDDMSTDNWVLLSERINKENN